MEMLKPHFTGIKAPPCCIELREGRWGYRCAGMDGNKKQPSPLLWREQPALGKPDPLVYWESRAPHMIP